MTPKPSLLNLPQQPGIYLMLNEQEVIIYIGKAKNLKKRVASYFQKKSNPDLKVKLMVYQIASVRTIVTNTEQEAFILENQLIKKYQPKYNILLKDDKSYPYIKITAKDHFPRLLIVRERIDSESLYFGPYPSMGSTKHLSQTLQTIFSVRGCKRAEPNRKCIKFDIKTCMGPCIHPELKPAYDQSIKELILFLSGKKKKLIKQLEKKMHTMSGDKKYEKAAEIRDQISSLENLSNRQLVSLQTLRNIHVWAHCENQNSFYALVQQYENGQLLSQKGFYLDKQQSLSLSEFLEQCLVCYYREFEIPKDALIGDTVLYDIFKTLQNHYHLLNGASFSVPKVGEKKSILELAEKNAKLSLIRLSNLDEKIVPPDPLSVLKTLQTLLHLETLPKKILGFDISHFSGKHIVGSSVCFIDGVPYPSLYRKFSIRSVVDKSDDPRSIFEIVQRRLNLCLKNQEPFPDLLLIDGGRGQLHAAHEATQGIHPIKTIALAKKEEAIYYDTKSRPLRIAKNNKALQLLQKIRDEAHRFAITLHRTQRKNMFFKSALTLLILLLFTHGQLNAAPVKKNLEKITDQIEANNQIIWEKRKKERVVLDDLIYLNRQIDRTSYKLNIAKKNLTKHKKDARATKKSLNKLERSFRIQQKRLAKRTVQIYKNKHWGILEFIFSTKDFQNIVNHSYFFEKIFRTDIANVKQIKDQYEILKKERDRLNAQTKRISLLKNDISQKQSELKTNRKQKSQYISLLRKDIEQYEKQNNELMKNSKEITNLIRMKNKHQFQGTGKFIKPTVGWISSRFGYRKHPIFKRVIFHTGLDIAAPRGYKILAADSGTVIFSGRKGGYGNATIIHHGSAYTSVYGHQSRILVQKGQKVTKGELIGYVGSTGYSTGPHLHFEIRKHGQPIDPLPFIRG